MINVFHYLYIPIIIINADLFTIILNILKQWANYFEYTLKFTAFNWCCFSLSGPPKVVSQGMENIELLNTHI